MILSNLHKEKLNLGNTISPLKKSPQSLIYNFLSLGLLGLFSIEYLETKWSRL